MIIDVEHLFHHRCDHCNYWWTNADKKPVTSKVVYCPSCGKENQVEGIKGHLIEEEEDNLTYPFEIYVVASHPSVEKIAYGAWYLDKEGADIRKTQLDKVIKGSYFVYRALIQIDKNSRK
ncbi:hypothetical protein H6G33_10275 [Calothrix sp. FACHB-1219]|uniref:hypothetical protein n=1 Tax=unclassified Calothrix TaxID=2619626 RepID=UPI0016836AC8|nr:MULTISPECIES: hypothetical protein [unclassified Calothrix]MBD2201733.1 hypothetical protein [Calothrix sp. FACHB-168]MBD2217419.1 hypothetical protein [Calothrix sp. FACHB-1219]